MPLSKNCDFKIHQLKGLNRVIDWSYRSEVWSPKTKKVIWWKSISNIHIEQIIIKLLFFITIILFARKSPPTSFTRTTACWTEKTNFITISGTNIFNKRHIFVATKLTRWTMCILVTRGTNTPGTKLMNTFLISSTKRAICELSPALASEDINWGCTMFVEAAIIIGWATIIPATWWHYSKRDTLKRISVLDVTIS